MLFFVYDGHVYGCTATREYGKAATLVPSVCRHGVLVSEAYLQIYRRSLILDGEVPLCPTCYDWVKRNRKAGAGHGKEAETSCESHPRPEGCGRVVAHVTSVVPGVHAVSGVLDDHKDQGAYQAER